MSRHLLSTLEGDDLVGTDWLRAFIASGGKFESHNILPRKPAVTPNPATPTTQPAPKSNALFWIAALGVGLYLITRKG